MGFELWLFCNKCDVCQNAYATPSIDTNILPFAGWRVAIPRDAENMILQQVLTMARGFMTLALPHNAPATSLGVAAGVMAAVEIAGWCVTVPKWLWCVSTCVEMGKIKQHAATAMLKHWGC